MDTDQPIDRSIGHCENRIRINERSIVSAARVLAGRQDELEPSLGYFSEVDRTDPYEAALREALVGEHRYRECQMVVLPSFEREWVVYIVREKDAPAQVLFKRFKRPLWDEMQNVMSDGGRNESISFATAQQAALALIPIELERSAAILAGSSQRSTCYRHSRAWSSSCRRRISRFAARYAAVRGTQAQ
jgi:hypothetical protein